MAINDQQQPIQEQTQAYSWPELFGQLVLDFTKVLEAEARLMRASIEPALLSVLEHWLWRLLIASFLLIGWLLLVAAAILVIHLWLAWWLAFAITGAVSILLALSGLMVA